MDTFIIFLAGYLHIVIVLLAFFLFLRVSISYKARLIVIMAIAAPLAVVVGKIASALYITVRPFVALNLTPLVAHAADNGFPSEHTLYAMTIAGAVFLIHKRWGSFLAVLALLVGVARVVALVHNPIDIIGSIVIAVLVTYFIARLPLTKMTLHVTALLQKYHALVPHL